MAGSTFSLGYRPALDGIRAVAVLLVMLHHLPLVYPDAAIIPGGFLGVDVFFVLSGFLITTLLIQRSGTESLRRFYGRRARRLLPALFVLLAAYVAWGLVVGTPKRAIAGLVGGSALYVLNLVQSVGAPAWTAGGHLWSLSVEEQFYLFWPVVLLALLRRPGRHRVLAIAGLVAAVAVWRFVSIVGGAAPTFESYVRTDFRLDSILVGALLAMVLSLGSHRPMPRVAGILGPVGVVVLGGFVLVAEPYDRWMYLGGFTVVAVAVTACVYGVLADTPLTRVLSHPWLVAVGKRSYSLYLWHVLWMLLVGSAMGLGPWSAVVAVSASAVSAHASYRFVEQPFFVSADRRPRVGEAAAEVAEVVKRPFAAAGAVLAGLVLVAVTTAAAVPGGRAQDPTEPVADAAAPPTTEAADGPTTTDTTPESELPVTPTTEVTATTETVPEPGPTSTTEPTEAPSPAILTVEVDDDLAGALVRVTLHLRSADGGPIVGAEVAVTSLAEVDTVVTDRDGRASAEIIAAPLSEITARYAGDQSAGPVDSTVTVPLPVDLPVTVPDTADPEGLVDEVGSLLPGSVDRSD